MKTPVAREMAFPMLYNAKYGRLNMVFVLRINFVKITRSSARPKEGDEGTHTGDRIHTISLLAIPFTLRSPCSRERLINRVHSPRER